MSHFHESLISDPNKKDLAVFDPNKDERLAPNPLTLMRPETGELISPERARQEKRIADATLRRTTHIQDWGPGDKFAWETPNGLTFSA